MTGSNPQIPSRNHPHDQPFHDSADFNTVSTANIGQQPAEASAPTPQKRKSVMVQLPEDLVKWRDTIWRERLAVDDKAEKSHIVEEALRAYRTKLDAEGDPFLK